jgi:GPH family glycoside/pentoside/hexuronide:cation symporter
MSSPVRTEAPALAAAPAVRVPAAVRLGYGVGNVAYSLPYQAVATFFLFFATVILRYPAKWAGLGIAISLAWDAVADPLAGHLSDGTRSRLFGRRHAYLLFGGLAVAALTWLLWSVPPGRSPFALVLGLLLLLRTALTAYYVPYLALGGELSGGYDERAAIQGVRAAFYLLGMILAIAGGTIVFFRATPAFPRGQFNPDAYPRMARAFAVVAGVAAVVGFLATRRHAAVAAEARSPKEAAGSLPEKFAAALRNRDLRCLLLMIFVLEAGFQFGVAIGIHVNTYTYGLSGPVIGLMALTILASSIASQPFWVAFTRRFEKRTALILALGLGVVGFAAPAWVLVWWKLFALDPVRIPWILTPFNLVAGFANGAYMSIPNAMVVDAADAEQLRSGRRDEGLYFGTYTFAYKLGVSIALVAGGLALSAIGFSPHLAAQSESTRFQLAMVPTYMLLLSGMGALFFVSRYSITREKWEATRRELDRRAAGAVDGRR